MSEQVNLDAIMADRPAQVPYVTRVDRRAEREATLAERLRLAEAGTWDAVGWLRSHRGSGRPEWVRALIAASLDAGWVPRAVDKIDLARYLGLTAEEQGL